MEWNSNRISIPTLEQLRVLHALASSLDTGMKHSENEEEGCYQVGTRTST